MNDAQVAAQERPEGGSPSPAVCVPPSLAQGEGVDIATVILASLLPYVGACLVPTVENIPGLLCLLFGWWSPPWYANVLLLLGGLFLLGRRPRTALTLGVCALLVALTVFFYRGISLGVGFYLWFGSLAVFTLGAFVLTCPAELRAGEQARPSHREESSGRQGGQPPGENPAP